MIEPLEGALGKILWLSEQKQAVSAELEQLAQCDATLHVLSPDERTVVREALARATQRGFADETDVDATLRQPWA